MGEIRIACTSETCGYPYLMCKKMGSDRNCHHVGNLMKSFDGKGEGKKKVGLSMPYDTFSLFEALTKSCLLPQTQYALLVEFCFIYFLNCL